MTVSDIEKALKKIEKGEYYQRFLMVVLILLFVFFIVAMFFFSDIRQLYRAEMNSYTFDLLLLGLLLLSLLFVSYIAIKDRSTKLFRNCLIQEKTAIAVLENEREKLSTLLEIGSLLSSNAEKQLIFDTICSGLARCLKGDQSSLMLYQKETEKLECVSCYGVQKELLLGQQLKLGQGIAGWVVQHRTPLLLAKDISRYDFINLTAKSRNITSAICVPLQLGGQIKGVLNISLIDKESHFFDENDLRIAKIFALSAVLAIDRTVHYETTRKLVPSIQTPA